MKSLLKKFNISVNKYYRMNDNELEQVANKWNIPGFYSGPEIANRQTIIDALLKKGYANNSRTLSLFQFLRS